MGQALYRKYRSKSLAEIVGQEHITRALTRALEQDKLSHAYLFTGPRGTGKTSIARILAFEVNGLPYDESATHLDIIEIDAASNRRIDEIRDLREKVHIAPTSAEYKVYIIDEVHMLTREAFNALLKTLEEPPAHVIFILATTEMHKLPDTIVSRTQHYAFKPIEKQQVIGHLRDMATKENVTIDDEALDLIAAHGEGSFRDSISLLDQIRNYTDSVTIQDVQAMLGIAPHEAIDKILAQLASHDAAQLIQTLTELHGQGTEASMLAKQLGQALRNQLLNNSLSLNADTTLKLLATLIDIPSSADPFTALEVCLLDAVFESSPPTQAAPRLDEPAATKDIPEVVTKLVAEKPVAQQTEAQPEQAEPVAETAAAVDKPKPSGKLSEATWPEVLAHLKTQYNTMYGVLRMARPEFAGNTLTLIFKFPFHQKRANDPKNKKIIIDAIEAMSGETMRVICTVEADEPAAKPPTPTKAAALPTKPDSLGSISNIFGGAELLES